MPRHHAYDLSLIRNAMLYSAFFNFTSLANFALLLRILFQIVSNQAYKRAG